MRSKEQVQKTMHTIARIKNLQEKVRSFSFDSADMENKTVVLVEKWKDEDLCQLIKQCTAKQLSEAYHQAEYKYTKCFIYDRSKEYNKLLTNDEQRQLISAIYPNVKIPLSGTGRTQELVSYLCKKRNIALMQDSAESILSEINGYLEDAGKISENAFRWLFKRKAEKKSIYAAAEKVERFETSGRIEQVVDLINNVSKYSERDFIQEDFANNKKWYLQKAQEISKAFTSDEGYTFDHSIDFTKVKTQIKESIKNLEALLQRIRNSDSTDRHQEDLDSLLDTVVKNYLKAGSTELQEEIQKTIHDIVVPQYTGTITSVSPLTHLVVSEEELLKAMEEYKQTMAVYKSIHKKELNLSLKVENYLTAREKELFVVAVSKGKEIYRALDHECRHRIQESFNRYLNSFIEKYPESINRKNVGQIILPFDKYNYDEEVVKELHAYRVLLEQLKDVEETVRNYIDEMVSQDDFLQEFGSKIESLHIVNDVCDLRDYLNNYRDYQWLLSDATGKLFGSLTHVAPEPRFTEVAKLNDAVKRLSKLAEEKKVSKDSLTKTIRSVQQDYYAIVQKRILGNLPVDCLNRDKENLRVSALKKNGYSSILDVPYKDERTLYIYSGMGEDSSKRVRTILRDMREEIQKNTTLYLSVFSATKTIRQLCVSIYDYISDGKNLDEISDILERMDYYRRLGTILSDPFTWFTTPVKKRDSIYKDQETILKLIERSNSITEGVNHLQQSEIQDYLYNHDRLVKQLWSGSDFCILPEDFNSENDVNEVTHLEDKIVTDLLCSSGIENRIKRYNAYELLTKVKDLSDFYYADEMDKIDFSAINVTQSADRARLLSVLGYKKVATGDYYLKGYESLEEYIANDMKEKELFSLEQYKDRFRGHYAVNGAINSLTKSLQLFEFEKNQYITLKRLNKTGVTSTDIRQFVNQVNHIADMGHYFNYSSVKDDLEDLKLCSLGFDDYFYQQLIRYCGEYKTLNLYNGVVFVNPKKEIGRQDFIRDVLGLYGNMDIDDFVEFINSRYHLDATKNYVLSDIKDTEMYYDRIMDKLYPDYDDYYNDI